MVSFTHFRNKGSICITWNLRSCTLQRIYNTNQVYSRTDIQGISRPIISKFNILLVFCMWITLQLSICVCLLRSGGIWSQVANVSKFQRGQYDSQKGRKTFSEKKMELACRIINQSITILSQTLCLYIILGDTLLIFRSAFPPIVKQ